MQEVVNIQFKNYTFLLVNYSQFSERELTRCVSAYIVTQADMRVHSVKSICTWDNVWTEHYLQQVQTISQFTSNTCEDYPIGDSWRMEEVVNIQFKNYTFLLVNYSQFLERELTRCISADIVTQADTRVTYLHIQCNSTQHHIPLTNCIPSCLSRLCYMNLQHIGFQSSAASRWTEKLRYQH